MNRFLVQGRRTIKGSIQPQGAKNEALQVMCAALLTESVITLENVPDIADVRDLALLLEVIGVQIERPSPSTYQLSAAKVDIKNIDLKKLYTHFTKIRGSIMILGPLLSRFGIAYIPQPGGDRIGRRRIDTHLMGMKALGATVTYNTSSCSYQVHAKRLTGQFILLDEASVTGTANVIMAATLAKGITTIYNAACEPYIQQLCHMLVRMGAQIQGIGSNLLTIEGVKALKGATHRLLPDMIEVGSFIGLAALNNADLIIQNAGVAHMTQIISVFRKLGVKINIKDDHIHIPQQINYTIERDRNGQMLTIYDAIWPGFPADLLSIVLVVATQANGSVLIHQKMFESRLFFVDRLIDMGAQIVLCDPHRANVIGLNRKNPLRGICMSSPDIRAGIALLIAALSAEGESIIEHIEQIDRGYSNIDQRINALGASIKRC